ncbi:MAG: peroxiredoxin [Candidatus Competibacterales bacterium]
MAHRLLIIVANAAPDDPLSLNAPFAQAAAAAAMEYDVEIVLSGRAETLARLGVAERIVADHGRTLYDVIKAIHSAGVTFKVCPAPNGPPASLIPEVAETVGGAYIVSEVMDEDTATLTY